MECIGKACFRGSGLQEIILPGTLRKIGYRGLKDCNYLGTVYVEDGCRINVKLHVSMGVQVQQNRAGAFQSCRAPE